MSQAEKYKRERAVKRNRKDVFMRGEEEQTCTRREVWVMLEQEDKAPR